MTNLLDLDYEHLVSYIETFGEKPYRAKQLMHWIYQESLIYFNEMTDLQTSMPNFHYIPTLSREEWKGHTGHVHPIYKEYAKDKPDAEFFLCGWKEMIDEAKQHLLEMGYDKKQIHLELYG